MTYKFIGDRKAIVSLPNGINLAIPTQDPFIGLQIALREELDPLLEQTLVEHLKPGARCINVGANVGYFSVLMAKLTRAPVFCFEPSPRNADLLIFNFYLNHLSGHAHVYRAAVSDTRGRAKFIQPNAFSDGWLVPANYQDFVDQPRFNEKTGLFKWEGNSYRDCEIIEVPVVSLDHILGNAGAFDFLLIDAEGFDLNVLAGATHVLSNSPELTIIFEWNTDCFGDHFSTDDLARCMGLLKARGYRTSASEADAWRPFDYEQEGMPKGNANILCELVGA